MHVWQAGGTADGLRRQLARALTDAEFAVSKQKQRKQAGEADEAATEEDGDDGSNLSNESDTGDSGANTEQAAGSTTKRTGGKRRRSSSKLAAEANHEDEPGDADSDDAIKGVSVDDLAQSLQQLLASIKAIQHQPGRVVELLAMMSGQLLRYAIVILVQYVTVQHSKGHCPGLVRFHAAAAGGAPDPAAGMAEQPAKPAAAEHAAEHAAGSGTERVFVDEETGEEFLLPPDKPVVAEGEEIFVDDRTGWETARSIRTARMPVTGCGIQPARVKLCSLAVCRRTYVVNGEDGSSASARRAGTLSRRLSDNMAWLGRFDRRGVRGVHGKKLQKQC